MTTKTLSKRHVVTLLYLLRGYAEQQRRRHGPGIERLGGLELTPNECDAWADGFEAEYAAILPWKQPEALPDNSNEEWLDT